jgi:hypothetical protein
VRRLLLGCVLIVGCGSSEDRSTDLRLFSDHAGGYSTVEPDATWTKSTDRGAVIFVGTGNRSKHTIVIRAAEKPSQLAENTPSTPTNVAIATERVLSAMPGARVEKKWQVEGTDLPTTEFSLTFTPTAASRRTYQRRHAEITASKHIFHVVYTAPADEDIDQATYDAMVAAIQEGA